MLIELFLSNVCIFTCSLQGLQCWIMENLVKTLFHMVIFTFIAPINTLQVIGLSALYQNIAMTVVQLVSSALVSVAV